MSWIDQYVELMFPVDVRNTRMEAGVLLKWQNTPKQLYKHRSVNDKSLKNLREDTVWMADPQSFNDPYDCHHYMDYDRVAGMSIKTLPDSVIETCPPDKREAIRSALETSPEPFNAFVDILLSDEVVDAKTRLTARNALADALKQTLRKMNAGRVDQIKSAFKVCSFSERVDSTLMWAHYADYHKGFCIEYDVHSLTPDDQACRQMYPVLYRDTPFDATESALSFGEASFNNLYLNLAGLIKAKDWEYEKEWRLMFANGIMEKAQPWKMPRPTGVYLGSHISAEHETELKDICADKGIPVFKMKHAPNAFKMEPHPVA